MFSRSRPSNRIRPPAMRPGYGTSRSTDSAVTVFPDPLSPMTPSTEFSSSDSETPLTAFTIPSRVGK